MPVGVGRCPERHQNDTTTTQSPFGLTSSALERCQETLKDVNYRGALTRLRLNRYGVSLHDFNLSIDHKTLLSFARQKASEAYELHIERQGHPKQSYEKVCEFVSRYTLTPVKVEADNFTQATIQMLEPSWWTRRLRQVQRELLDNISRDIGLVSKRHTTYSSEVTNWLHADQQARNHIYLQKSVLTNAAGEQVSLAEIAEHSLANPSVRQAEMMTRIRGFEQLSDIYGHQGLFFTLTCPSRFHASMTSGKRNPKATGATPRDGQAWLCKRWGLIRAKLHRAGLRPYGFRVAEPHHDATPHWHLLLFIPPEHAKKVDRIIRRYMSEENEPGAAKYRVKTIFIDPAQGSAAGYIAKYISKNLDGKHLDQDHYGSPGHEAASRIRCWASTHRIRQFQQIGGPSVSVWRELRRLRQPDQTPAVEQARCAADVGDWAAFVIAMGGIDLPRSDRPIHLHHEFNELVDTSTGEVLPDDMAWHGGSKSKPVQGLKAGGLFVRTRTHQWCRRDNIALLTSVCSAGANGMSGSQAPPGAVLDLCK